MRVKLEPVQLVGEHIAVVPMTFDHIESLFEAGRFAGIWSYMSKRVETVEDMRDLISEALTAQEQAHELPFVIYDRRAGRLVGGSTRFLDISPSNRSLEIGSTWLTPTVWRTQVNTETKYLLLRHCFETLGLIRVQLKTDSRNVQSQRAIERIGGVKEGILRKHRVMHDGYFRDSVYYSILDDEWPAVKKRLECWLR